MLGIPLAAASSVTLGTPSIRDGCSRRSLSRRTSASRACGIGFSSRTFGSDLHFFRKSSPNCPRGEPTSRNCVSGNCRAASMNRCGPFRSIRCPTKSTVGHLIERKGPHLFIEAARQFPETQFRLVGSPRGQFGEDLRKKCKSLPNVRLENPMPQARLADVLRESDLLLHPSRIEGVPKVTLEAAASGMPSIVFDDYQTPSVVDGVTGFQVKTFDEMLARLKLLIRDGALRKKMGAAAVAHAQGYDWRHVAARWAQTVEHLVRQG